MAQRYASPSLKEWMRGVNLSKTTRDLMEKLSYRNGNMLFFADTSLLMEHIPTVAEQQDIFRALSREKTILIKICLSDDSDTYSLAEYWGRGNRAKDVFPLLDSLKRKAGDRYVDIVHLLPPFVRSRIYTYPDINSLTPETQKLYDCHWTSFNFFNTVPDNSYNTSQKIKQHIETDFHTLTVKQDELQLGDILLYLNNDRLLHSAVYIAADILFTKNGTNLSSPWMFMHMNDMEHYYACNQPLKILYLRNKKIDLNSGKRLAKKQSSFQSTEPAAFQPGI